jgi:hypothetical protein
MAWSFLVLDGPVIPGWGIEQLARRAVGLSLTADNVGCNHLLTHGTSPFLGFRRSSMVPF